MILYFLLLLFVSAKKNHTFTLKISKRNNNPIASGASALARFSSTKTNVNLKNIGNYFYQVYVYIGNGQSFLLDLDTGSADTWVRGPACSSTDGSCSGARVNLSDTAIKPLGESFQVTYGSGQLSANIYITKVNIGGAAATIPIGVSTYESGFVGNSGLVGLAYNSLSEISSTTGKNANYFDALGFSPSYQKFSFYLSNAANGDYGEITIGGIDSTRFKGTLQWVPVISKTYWQFDVSKVTFKAGTKVGSVGNVVRNAISDTGTTLIILYAPVADAINQGIGASPYDSSGGYYPIACSKATSGPNIEFKFPNFTLSIPSNIYVIDLGGGNCASGIDRGAGSFNIFGDVLTRAYYTVYDKQHSQIGFSRALHP
ncbi:Vacuolar protease A [Boothiomyces sp. JEL0838]|nr:Vacuolar protease A [Boothiomyces sp. JEL0838]